MLLTDAIEVEPFDFSLQDQVRKAYQEVEQETIKLTKMRRDAPSEIKKSYEDSLEQSVTKIEALQKELEQLEDEIDVEFEDHEEKFNQGVKSRLDDIIADYEESIKSIKDIKDVSIKKSQFNCCQNTNITFSKYLKKEVRLKN